MSASGHLMYEQHGVMGGTPVGSSWWFQADVHRLAVVDSRPLRATTKSEDVMVDSTVDVPQGAGVVQAGVAGGGGGGFLTQPPMFEEIVDVISQVDVVRCLLDAYDRGYPADHRALKRALDEPVTTHLSRPFGSVVPSINENHTCIPLSHHHPSITDRRDMFILTLQ